MNACIDQTLNELVHAAIATAERKQEVCIMSTNGYEQECMNSPFGVHELLI